jgi:hypothetical protein
MVSSMILDACLLAAKAIFSRRKYTTMDEARLDALVEDIQTDMRLMRLLGILGEQVGLFLNRGRPDLGSA